MNRTLSEGLLLELEQPNSTILVSRATKVLLPIWAENHDKFIDMINELDSHTDSSPEEYTQIFDMWKSKLSNFLK